MKIYKCKTCNNYQVSDQECDVCSDDLKIVDISNFKHLSNIFHRYEYYDEYVEELDFSAELFNRDIRIVSKNMKKNVIDVDHLKHFLIISELEKKICFFQRGLYYSYDQDFIDKFQPDPKDSRLNGFYKGESYYIGTDYDEVSSTLNNYLREKKLKTILEL
jgi:rRNA maturation protein Nop10